jgi:hypothetical protein
MLLYPLAYAVVWSLPTGIRIYQAASGQPAPWQLQTVDKTCIVLQGLVDAVIYGTTESSLSSWRNLFFPGRFPTVNGVAPALGYGNLSGSGSKRWSSKGRAGEQQLVSNSGPHSAGDNTPSATTRSADSLGSESDAAGTAADSSEQIIELASLEGGKPAMGIQRTVEIEVSISGAGQDREGREVAHPRPPKAYFPEESRGSFLNV